MENILKIQKVYRGHILRLKRLPLMMYKLQSYLKSKNFKCSTIRADGRSNSIYDEDEIIKLCIEKFGNRIKKSVERMWHDMLALDYVYGWIPINIKTTSMHSADNVGNMTLCVYAYTNHPIDLNRFYCNGEMSSLIVSKLKQKGYNTINKRDYYFLVLNKTDSSDVIINSVKGLSNLTQNLNNLPFQVRWTRENRTFVYKSIKECIKQFRACFPSTPKVSWREKLKVGMNELDL